jgi:class 3 adenylate cyclase
VATFDGPGRAIRCGVAIIQDLRSRGLDPRGGVHSGECEVTNGQTGGIAVAIAERVCALACGGELLVSQTARDVVFGSTITFSDPRDDELEGLPPDWRVFTVTAV